MVQQAVPGYEFNAMDRISPPPREQYEKMFIIFHCDMLLFLWCRKLSHHVVISSLNYLYQT